MKKTSTSVLYVAIITINLAIFAVKTQNWLNSSDTYIVEAKTVAVTPTVVPTATSTPRMFNSEVEQYVYDKFGEDHYQKAFDIITCESNWRATAYNDNRTWGGVGEDRGYWQINNVYHPHITDECAKDFKCSTDYAYRMWKNDNKTFIRWTCGRK